MLKLLAGRFKKFVIVLFVLNALNTQNVYADTFTVDSLVSADDVTMSWLNGFKNTVIDALNSFPGENIEASSITTAAFDNNANPEYRWGESFNEFVYTGLLAPTAAGLSTTTTAGIAYIKEDSTSKMIRVVKDATANTYTASKDTYVDLSTTGTYTYSEVALGAATPAVAANSIRLFKVVTDATDVTTVTDLRVTGVQLSTSEDYQLKGMELNWGNGDIISTDAGVVYVGTTRVKETTFTNLNLGTAADYITGISERGANKFIYVYIDSTGSVKLDDSAPDYADTDGNTTGILRYFKNGTDYWRCLGAVLTDASQYVIRFYNIGNEMFYDDSANTAAALRVLNAGASVTFADVDCSGAVPSIASGISFNAQGAGADSIIITLRNNGSAATSGINQISLGTNNDYGVIPITPCDNSRIVEYKVNAGNTTLWLRSYKIKIRD